MKVKLIFLFILYCRQEGLCYLVTVFPLDFKCRVCQWGVMQSYFLFYPEIIFIQKQF